MGTVSMVLVSHSRQLAEGVRELAAQMTQGKVKIAVAGGTADGRLGTDATAILGAIEEVDEGCCGISGTFGVKVEKYDLSMKIGSRLFEAVKAAGSDYVLADCETCRMQVEHGAGASSAHPLEILARAYGHG